MSALQAALVTPLSGALARYGRAGAAALAIWAEQAADLPAPWKRVELDVRDSRPEPATALRAAVAARPHVVFGPYGTGPAVAAAGATERVLWNHGGAASRLAWSAFPRVVNVLAPASTYLVGVLEVVRAADPAARTVALLHADTGFARDVAAGAADTAGALGFALQRVAFTPGAGGEAAAGLRDADVLLVAAGFADELAAARALLDRPWGAAAFVGAGVEDVLDALGDGREGLLGPAQWLATAAPRPDEGPDAGWFVRAYRRATGAQPPYPAVQAFAAGVLCARCLREAGAHPAAPPSPRDDQQQLAAATALRCTTVFGDFRLDPDTGLQVGHRVLTVQWQDGARRVVWPPERAERPLRRSRPQR